MLKLKEKTRFAIAALTWLTAVPAMADDVPAFPGSEGHARYTTTGGRSTESSAAKIYHVTNLADNAGTKGCLRWALNQTGPRIIVFDVSGYIDLRSELPIPANTTIAGQTAPGEGITLRYYTVNFNKGDNIIVRFIRFRRSQVKSVDDGADAAWGRQHRNIILDHCSFSWSIDEIASFYDNRNFTMQWCTLGEALANPGHSKGEHSYGGIWGGKEASFHHNFLLHMQNRVPRFNGARYNWTDFDNTKYENTIQAEQVDFRNCVMYNWGNGNGCYGGPGGGYVNIVNNYYQAGPATSNKMRVTQISKASASNAGDNPFPDYTSRYYISGNYVTAAGTDAANYDWKGVAYDSGIPEINGERYTVDPNHYYGSSVEYVKNGSGVDCVKIKLDNPQPSGDVTTHSAVNAYDKVLAYSGVSLFRDAVDVRYAEEARTGTTTYTGPVTARAGIVDYINDPSATEDVTLPSFPALKSDSRPAGYDTDGDGIPDEWETANGLNPNDASDALTKTLDKEKGWYLNIEVYLNSIVEDIVRAGNDNAITSVNEYYPAYNKVVTSVGAKVLNSSSVESIEYYTLDGKRISSPLKGISVRKIKYSDGTVDVDKVVKK